MAHFIARLAPGALTAGPNTRKMTEHTSQAGDVSTPTRDTRATVNEHYCWLTFTETAITPSVNGQEQLQDRTGVTILVLTTIE